MLENTEYFNSIISTVTEIIQANHDDVLLQILSSSEKKIEQTNYDNWNGGTYVYTIFFLIDVKLFLSIKDREAEVVAQLDNYFSLATKHLDNESISKVCLVPQGQLSGMPLPDPHRVFSAVEEKKKRHLAAFLERSSEDDLISHILLPLFRQLGFHRITFAGHTDKALEYGKDIWMRYTLPTRHILYFGIQVKKGKLDAAGISKGSNSNVAEIHNQALMMLGHEIFDSEIGKRVLVDHAFIVAGGEITKAARNWIGNKLDVLKRSQILFMDREDILNLFVASNLPLPSEILENLVSSNDELPF